MRKLLFILLLPIHLFAQNDYDTLKGDYYIDDDTIGKHVYYIGKNIPIGAMSISTSDNMGNTGSIYYSPYINSFEVVGNNLLANMNIHESGMDFNYYYNYASGFGVKFTVGIISQFVDSRPLKRGFEYASTGCVTQPHSMADKEYVDLNALRVFTKTSMPSPNVIGHLIYVTNATGGACPAYSDGNNWRRFSDNSIIN